jgi:hypothetical protein
VITVERCDKSTIKKIAEGLEKAALGKTVSFVFEEGMHRIEDQGQVYEQPNGTATFRLFINGGAKDSGDEVKADGHSSV